MEQQNGPFYLKFMRWKQRPDQTVQDFIQKVQIKSKLIDLPEDQVIGPSALMKGFLPQIRAD